MALITTIAEVQEVLRISGLNNANSLPDFETAEDLYILPVLGPSLYDALLLAYKNNTLSSNQRELLFRVRKALAPFAYVDDSGLGNVIQTDQGLRQISTDDLTPAYKWQAQEYKDALKTKAYNAMESLFRYLIKNKILFSWDDSDRKRYLFQNGMDFSDCYTLFQPLRTYFLLRPIISKVEDLYIKKTIGAPFFQDLKNKSSFTTDEAEAVRLLKMAIAHFTIKHATESMPTRKSEGGFTVLNATVDKEAFQSNQGAAPAGLLADEKTAAERDGQQYLKDAKFLLNSKASSTVFPLYFSSSLYEDVTVDRSFTNSGRKIFRF